jgi:hypothetical protein
MTRKAILPLLGLAVALIVAAPARANAQVFVGVRGGPVFGPRAYVAVAPRPYEYGYYGPRVAVVAPPYAYGYYGPRVVVPVRPRYYGDRWYPRYYGRRDYAPRYFRR